MNDLIEFTANSSTIKDAAKALGLSKRGLQTLQQKEDIAARKVNGVWRIPHAEIIRLANGESA